VSGAAVPYNVVVHQAVYDQLEQAPKSWSSSCSASSRGLRANPYKSTAFYHVYDPTGEWVDAVFAGSAGFLTYRVAEAQKTVLVRWVTWLG
jgi:hypothetical protein